MIHWLPGCPTSRHACRAGSDVLARRAPPPERGRARRLALQTSVRNVQLTSQSVYAKKPRVRQRNNAAPYSCSVSCVTTFARIRFTLSHTPLHRGITCAPVNAHLAGNSGECVTVFYERALFVSILILVRKFQIRPIGITVRLYPRVCGCVFFIQHVL